MAAHCEPIDLSPNVGHDLLWTAAGRKFSTILADPPWQFQNRTGKVAPEHKRLSRYGTMTLDEIKKLPVLEFRPVLPFFTCEFRTLWQ